LLGASEICVPKESAAAVTDACSKLHTVCDGHRFSDDSFFFNIPIGDEKKVVNVLQDSNITYKLIKRTGILAVARRYRLRYGFILGALLFTLITFLSSSIVWQIEITGNSILSNEEVLDALGSSGLSLGTPLKDIDTDKIERSAVVNEKRLSWISVNMNGTTAYVEIRERTDADKAQRIQPYANILSADDAIIVDIEVFSGMAAVKKGSYVRKGEMLINGIIHKEALGTYPTYASGRVVGRIFKSFELEFPYRELILENTGKKVNVVKAKIFGKEVIFSAFSPKYDSYSVYAKELSISKGSKVLPFSLTVEVFNEQVPRAVYRTPEETHGSAISFLWELIEKDYPDAEIVEKHITVTHTEKSLVLRADVALECEIGRVAEFNIEN
jgi:similar to stage IV sporulation protein